MDNDPDNAADTDSARRAELFELIVESSTDFAIFTTDSEGLATSWNIGAERLFGYPEPEIVGRSADVVFVPEDRAEGVAAKERTRARTEGKAIDERWHQRRDGSRFWASGLMMPLKRSDGFVKITRDRTEQHDAEARLEENEQRFRLLATSIPQLVFRTHPDGERTWGSPQWIEFTGLSMEESLGFGWLDAVHPDDLEATQKAWRDARERGEYYVEHRIRRAADGEYRWHQTRARPIGDGDHASADWVGTMTDIHDLKDLQGRQQVLLAELQHRTRNLLAVVQSVASQTLRKSPSVEAFGGDFEARLRALSRVQGLLARFDHGDIDLRILVEAELGAIGEDALASGRVTIDGPEVFLPSSSAQALGLALHELATNALKYGALGRADGTLAVSWRLDQNNGPAATLEWRESGVPMPEGGAKRKGYGSELIERALPYQLGARTRLEFTPDGLRCSITVAVADASAERRHG